MLTLNSRWDDERSTDKEGNSADTYKSNAQSSTTCDNCRINHSNVSCQDYPRCKYWSLLSKRYTKHRIPIPPRRHGPNGLTVPSPLFAATPSGQSNRGSGPGKHIIIIFPRDLDFTG